MTLRAIHDFELALLDPYLAMTERGIPVDEDKRQSMLADLEAAKAPLYVATTNFVTQVVLPQHSERLDPAKAHLFQSRIVCKCCRNGSGKRDACWACAGFEAKPTKKQLAQMGAEEGCPVDLAPCKVCNGAGAFESTVFNPNSADQLKVVLYDLLRMPKRMKKSALTVEEKALKSLLAEARTTEVRDFIMQILRLGKIDTMRAVLERIKPGPDGRIHSVYNPAGTETGRPTASETFLIHSTNLNNMPKREATEALFDVKAVFMPPPGYVFVEADLSGAEQWVTSAAAGDKEFLEVMRTPGLKVHRWTAARALNKSMEDVTEQEYALYKTARHALNYGMQWKTFMENVNEIADRTGVAVTAAQAKKIYADYHALHPRLSKHWWPEVQGKLVRTGSLTTCFGRKRTFYGRNRGEWLGETHREAIAHESQSTISDLLNRGLLRWWRQHDGKVGELLAQVYDSMLIMCKESQAQLCATLVKRCMTEEIEVHGIKLTVPVDVKILRSWAALEQAA